MKSLTFVPADKDPERLSGDDALAHQVFLSLETRRGKVASAIIDEPITVVAANPDWADWFVAEAARIRESLLSQWVPGIEHIGSTAVPGLDAKPIIDIMLGIDAPSRLEEVLPVLEQLGYQSLGIAGVPGRWALRRRAGDRAFNVSVVAFQGNRWRENVATRDYLSAASGARKLYGEAKRRAVADGATTLFVYSEAKRASVEAIVAQARAAAALCLVKPSLEFVPDYAAALTRGWSPDNVRGAEAAREQLQRIRDDPTTFIAQLDDPEAQGEPVRLPDGSTARRLPGFRRWIWDGEFCGSIGFRWQPGMSELPPHVLGHIGYTVVPWKQGRGYAKAALALLLPEAREKGLRFVELTTDPDNIASQAVIRANGGALIERFRKPAAYGSHEALRFRIAL